MLYVFHASQEQLEVIFNSTTLFIIQFTFPEKLVRKTAFDYFYERIFVANIMLVNTEINANYKIKIPCFYLLPFLCLTRGSFVLHAPYELRYTTCFNNYFLEF